MQHLKSALMVALICIIVMAAVNRVDFARKIVYPSAA